jgi:signal transduction histidine kinase
MLQHFLAAHREAIVRRCWGKVADRTAQTPAGEWIEDGVPRFLDQLERALQGGAVCGGEAHAVDHGRELQAQGFGVSELVHRYGDVCLAITELAAEFQVPIDLEEFRLLNRCLDEAIADAVTQFARRQNQALVDAEKARGTEQAGFLAHEMRNLLNTASMAFDVLRTGKAGIAGSTGAILQRSLAAARTLTNRSLAEIRLARGAQQPERFGASAFIDELAATATLEGNARGIGLRVIPLEAEVFIEADRQLLAAVAMNLLQNAFKFTKPASTVVLRVRSTGDSLLLDIEDECGGLAIDSMDDLFRPFEQRGADRTGLGLGLAFSLRAVEANHGRIHVRNVPGKGCVFTVSLPRASIPAVAK